MKQSSGLSTILILMVMMMTANVSAAQGNWTQGDNFTDSFNIESGDINSTVSVNTFGNNLENLTAKYVDNKSGSRTFNVELQGNISEVVDTPTSFTLFHNESGGFPVVANVPLSQDFGVYTGNLSMTGKSNSNFTDSVNISVEVVDDVPPTFTELDVGSVQATESVVWTAEVEDNLNISSVDAQVLREVNQTVGNTTELVNQSFKNVSFEEMGDGSFQYTFTDTQGIGQYFLNATVTDSSNNTNNEVRGFQVTGLDSITVLDSNFVFDTMRPKEDTEYELINNRLKGKSFTVSVENLSYGGNETVRIGVLPPEGDSPEIIDKGSNKNFSSQGSYKLVLIHTGSNEIKGTHRVTGELKVTKPSHHVEPVTVDVSFSGTVKNLDKPSEKCERIKEYDSCIAYSLDQARSMFEEQYNLSSEESKDFAYLIGRIPTSSVEGTDSWGEDSSLTFGEYNESEEENTRLKNRVDELEKENGFKNAVIFWLVIGIPAVSGGLFGWYFKIGKYMSVARNREKMIKKADIVDPEEGLK